MGESGARHVQRREASPHHAALEDPGIVSAGRAAHMVARYGAMQGAPRSPSFWRGISLSTHAKGEASPPARSKKVYMFLKHQHTHQQLFLRAPRTVHEGLELRIVFPLWLVENIGLRMTGK